MMEWVYIIFTAMIALFAFGWGIDDEDPNSFTKFLICVILMVIMFCIGIIMFPQLFSEF